MVKPPMMLTPQQVAAALTAMPARVQAAVFDALDADLRVQLIQHMSTASPSAPVESACQQLLATLLSAHPEVLAPTLRGLSTSHPPPAPPVLLSLAFPDQDEALAQRVDTDLLRQLPLRTDEFRREFLASLKTRFMLDFPSQPEPPDLLGDLLQSHPDLVGTTLKAYLHDKNRQTISRRLQRLRQALALCTPAAVAPLSAKLEEQFPGMYTGPDQETRPEMFYTVKLLSKFLGAYPQACLTMVATNDLDQQVWDRLASPQLAPQWIDFILDHKHW